MSGKNDEPSQDKRFGAEPAPKRLRRRIDSAQEEATQDHAEDAGEARGERLPKPKADRTHSSEAPSVEAEWVKIAEGFGVWESSEADFIEIPDDGVSGTKEPQQSNSRATDRRSADAETLDEEVSLGQWIELEENGTARFLATLDQEGKLKVPAAVLESNQLEHGAVLLIQSAVIKRGAEARPKS